VHQRRLALAILLLVLPLGAQQRFDYMAHYGAFPGGTPEDELWQVLILFGTSDKESAEWDGSMEVAAGEVFNVDGYRFEPPDEVTALGGWRATTRIERVSFGSGIAHGVARSAQELLPKGLLVRGKGSVATRLALTTKQGAFEVRPMRQAFGEWIHELDGRVSIQRVPPATDLSGTELRQHDFPSIVAGSDGALSVVWQSYHDRREELNFRRYFDGRWTRLIPVGRAAEDLWRPHVTTAENGKPWLIWSQRPATDGPGNWDLYAMAWEDNEWGKRVRLTDNPLPDIEPDIARAPDGTVYVVWQSMAGRSSQIRLKYLRAGEWSETVSVTNSEASNWEPAVAAGPDGAAWIAWDRYDGNYDVWARRFSPDEGLGEGHRIASTARFEAHASVAVDARNRPWVGWETGETNWGKDTGAVLGANAPGSPLGGIRRIEVVCLDGAQWKAPAALQPSDPLAGGASGESRPMLYVDPNGGLWMSFKRRYARRAINGGVHWESFLTRLEGGGWSDPIVLPNSWTRKSTRMRMTSLNGRLWAFWPHESRNWAFTSRPHASRVVAGSIELPGRPTEPMLTAYKPAPAEAIPVHPNEPADVRAIRGYRAEVGGESYRILRGDLHRHTELSQDQGGLDDGSLPEFYRYMIDAADMDFGASTDHQAGGTDYWNFMTQKMTDMYHFPERYSTLYAYERNLGNPFGHRNMVYTHRDYPIVPFFQSINPKFMMPDTPDGELLTFNSNSFGSGIRNDTRLLYEVVKETGGLAIPHTSGSSGMGTDWADNDPEVDAVVEIYQGARVNNEHEGAPRWKTPDGKQPGNWQSPGAVWNAWKKGYRIGVIASSDHYSTHISYAMVYSPSTSRDDVHQSIRARRTYGATDNIVLDFRIGEHFMGEEFSSSENQPIHVRAMGTGAISAIHLIRDGAYLYKATPNSPEAEFTFVDNDAGKGSHWYYVRVEQENGELAWSSPIWRNGL